MTFFWQYMLSLYLPLQILLSNVFPKEPSTWFVILVAGFRIILTRPRHSEQVCSIVSGLLFSSLRNLLKDLLNHAGELPVVLIFDICNVYEIVVINWLYSQYWGWVKMVDTGLKFLVNIKDWHLFLVCLLGWFGSVKRQE